MLIILALVSMQCVFAETLIPDAADVQLLSFKSKTSGPIGTLTTTSGEPVEYNDAMDTINTNLLTNRHFLGEITHIVREKIPERVVHAKGAGAFGYFEVTDNITRICKADFLSEIGKKTPVVVRFSPGFSNKGGSDSKREIRGFAIKFYTKQGNFDLLGLHTELFALKDPVLFPSFIHSNTRNPRTDMLDNNAFNDFRTLRPESLFLSLILASDRGIPDGYRHMAGFPIHTFQVVNKHGDIHFVRWHVLPDAGQRFLTTEEAAKRDSDLDYAVRDLYNAIENGNFPSWTVFLQILSMDDVKKSKFNIFDTTKILPHNIYPLQRVGRLVLNRNPSNFFADIEQLAFDPDNLVPGMNGAPDKLYEGRRLSYRDAQLYRLGPNFNKITINCPLHKPTNYIRDGRPPVRDNSNGAPNYYPNSFHGPVPYIDEHRTELMEILNNGLTNNFDQLRDFYENELSDLERRHLVTSTVTSLRSVADFIQERLIKLLTHISPDFGNRVLFGLYANNTDKINN